MRKRLLLSYVSITVIVLVAFGVPLGLAFGNAERKALQAGIQQAAFAFVNRVQDPLVSGDPAARAGLQQMAVQYKRETDGRVVIVDTDGMSVADSDAPGGVLVSRSFADRAEFATALAGGEASGSRYSSTLGTELVYVAVPVVNRGQVVGAVRLSYPVAYVDRRVARAWLLIAGAGVLILIVVTVVSLLLARSVARPLEELERTAERIGDGDLAARALVPTKPPEVRVLAEQFNQTAARLEILVESQRAFVADASHQLRTPLAALRLRIENLTYDLDTEHREDLDGALAEVARLSRLVDDLLALARAEQEVAAPTALSLRQILDERAQAWGALFEEQQVHLDIVVADELVTTTPGRLDQVFDNLLNNALAVTPIGGTIEIRVQQRDANVDVWCGDSGPGMTPEQRARAFDRFWRAPTATRGTGSGLGLAIVAQLTRLDGGDVSLGVSHLGGLEVHLSLRAAVTNATV